jgi:hypothetical protein
MYLDPGSTSLLIQALFALVAGAIAFFSRARLWIVAMFSKAIASIRGLVGRRPKDP